MPGPVYTYALIYAKGVTEKTTFEYVTDDLDQAQAYQQNVYPGTTVIQLTVIPPGV
jgi:hypothetical protein